MGGPQIRLGAATVEKQEVHTSWTALTNSCAKEKDEGEAEGDGFVRAERV